MNHPVADFRGVRRPDGLATAWALPASWLYGFGVNVRRWMYDGGLLTTRRVALPVISIGALAVGGSGKTPFVRWLAGRLVELGVPVSILSRGYGGTGGPESRRVDPERPDARRDGDEPALLARSLPDVPILVGPNRARSAALAEGLGAKLLLLDDGFQHRKLHRDLNVVLWDESSAQARGRVLPAGCLREPMSALARADVLVRMDRGQGAPEEPPGAPEAILTARLRPIARQELPADTRVHALSAIAGPESFEHGLAELGAVVTGATRFADHQAFTADEIRAAAERARQEGADVIATTAKDWARWPADTSGLPVPAVFDLEVTVEGGEGLIGRAVGLAREEGR